LRKLRRLLSDTPSARTQAIRARLRRYITTKRRGDPDIVRGGEGTDYRVQGDYLIGHGGSDELRAGDDRVEGGPGDDRLFGDAGSGGDGDDIVRLGADELYGGAGNDHLSSDAIDNVEVIFGGDDQLHGDAGDDSHDCGPGLDDADGGLGFDVQVNCEVIESM
jgi:Ca2+-binding RTX toxin-like protein